jgi:lysozyme
MNEAGLNLIRNFEGCVLDAYPDPGTGASPWTIGYGCTFGVKKGDKITRDMANVMLMRDVEHFEKCVKELLTVDVTPNQLAAMIALAYNIGMANFGSSTLLRMVNAKDPKASEQFLRWNRAAGKVMDGLTRRRAAEKALFDTP